MIRAYYNEIDPYAAQWLRNLIAAGHIAPGDVDERSIEDVRPIDLIGYTQCHFFAGIGVWSTALRGAGWDDSRPVWTASCPCQPFSAAGKGAGFDDERHLWPALHHLISECEPAIVFGEQVASKDVDPWIDLVHDDLEALGYAFGAIPFPSAGVGAPHIRDRLYWMGYSDGSRLEGHPRNGRAAGRKGSRGPTPAPSISGGLVDSDMPEPIAERSSIWQQPIRVGNSVAGEGHGGNPTNGFWASADWLGCRDGLYRPVEPGTFPLAHGVACRMDKLRAYGNAINREAAIAFIGSAMEAELFL